MRLNPSGVVNSNLSCRAGHTTLCMMRADFLDKIDRDATIDLIRRRLQPEFIA
jgi:hypothetical protein